MRVLVTGAAGFIGYHTAKALLERGEEVIGLDNLNTYYDVNLKEARLNQLQGRQGFTFHKLDLADRAGMERLFAEGRPQWVIHLGAQAGVRYGLENPQSYVDSNIVGTLHVLEAAVTTASSISSSRRQARSTAPTRRCPSASIRTSTIR